VAYIIDAGQPWRGAAGYVDQLLQGTTDR